MQDHPQLGLRHVLQLVKLQRPKICQKIHPPHPWASSTSLEAISSSHDPRGPHQTPKRMGNTPQINCFPQQGFTQLKSICRGPKFARQFIRRILGPHPHPRRPSPSAMTPGLPLDLKGTENTPQKTKSNFDFICMKPCKGKTVDLGGVFHPFGGLMGVPGVMAGGYGFLGWR